MHLLWIASVSPIGDTDNPAFRDHQGFVLMGDGRLAELVREMSCRHPGDAILVPADEVHGVEPLNYRMGLN